MTRLKAAAECKVICDKLQEEIQRTFAGIADEELGANRPGIASIYVHFLRKELLVARKELDALAEATEKGDSVVPFTLTRP
jgi:hypothetical protein